MDAPYHVYRQIGATLELGGYGHPADDIRACETQDAVGAGCSILTVLRTERTLLYLMIKRRALPDDQAPLPGLRGHLADNGKQLPAHTGRAFEDYLQCGRLEHDFLRLRCEDCHADTCWRSVASAAASVRAAAPGVWPRARPCCRTRCYRSADPAVGAVQLPDLLRFLLAPYPAALS